MTSYEVAIVGGGHNGLVAGCYLARAGLDVGVFEAADHVGGGLHTEAFDDHPGFLRNHHAVNLGGLIQSPVRRDLDLQRYGAQLINPSVKMAMPLADDRALVLYGDPHLTKRSIASFSERDADRYEELYYKWNRMSYSYQQPEWYNPPESADARSDRFTSDLGREYLELCGRRPVDVIEEEFTNEHVRAFFTGIVSAAGRSAFSSGAGGRLVRAFNRRHNLCIARGGSNTYAQALRRCFEAAGGDVHVGHAVDSIPIEDGRARGISLNGGPDITADVVVSTGHFPQTYLGLVGREHLSEPFISAIEDEFQLRTYGLFGVHLALTEAPTFRARSHNPDIDHAVRYLVGRDTLEDRRQFHETVAAGELPADPLMNTGAVSVLDPTQAPSGNHVAHLWAPGPWRPDGRPPETWDELADDFGDVCTEHFATYAPNVTEETIVDTHFHSPIDALRAHPNMLRGTSAGVRGLSLTDRPAYDGPIEGLYLASAATHPGGSVCGAPGYNCAGVVLADLGIEPWWSTPEPGS